MDEIKYTKECEIVLDRLLQNEVIYKSDVVNISPSYYDTIIQDFLDRKIIKQEFLDSYSVNKDVAYRYFNNRSFERKIDSLISNIKRDELAERSTISSEVSARMAEKSSEAAVRSANAAEKAIIEAKKANRISNTLKRYTALSVIIAILGVLLNGIKSCTS